MASKEIIAQKEQLVADVAEKIAKAKSIVLVNHCGLTVEQDTALRVDMRKNGKTIDTNNGSATTSERSPSTSN